MYKTQTALLDCRQEDRDGPCSICELASRDTTVESDLPGKESIESPAPLCSAHRHEVQRLLDRGEPGIDAGNAHLIYRKLYEARRGGRLKRFGELASPVPSLPR
jgi:hypothetical protein